MENEAPQFIHQRHKQLAPGAGAASLILACPPLRSNVNLARIVRAASCCGVRRMLVCGASRIDPKIARDGVTQMQIDRRRSLEPQLRKWREEGLRLVGLEQTTNSQCLYDYRFARETVLVVGHERQGLSPEVLRLLHDVVEIPMYGLPHSFNVATATAIALYEYCRQHRGAVAGDAPSS